MRKVLFIALAVLLSPVLVSCVEDVNEIQKDEVVLGSGGDGSNPNCKSGCN